MPKPSPAAADPTACTPSCSSTPSPASSGTSLSPGHFSHLRQPQTSPDPEGHAAGTPQRCRMHGCALGLHRPKHRGSTPSLSGSESCWRLGEEFRSTTRVRASRHNRVHGPAPTSFTVPCVLVLCESRRSWWEGPSPSSALTVREKEGLEQLRAGGRTPITRVCPQPASPLSRFCRGNAAPHGGDPAATRLPHSKAATCLWAPYAPKIPFVAPKRPLASILRLPALPGRLPPELLGSAGAGLLPPSPARAGPDLPVFSTTK